MQPTMYSMSIPIFKRMLTNLSAIIDKAAAHVEARKIDPAVLLSYRLYPDMLPFIKQVQIPCDFVKGCAARLGGVEIPKFDDNEASFADLQARIKKTLDFADSVDPKAIDASADREIVIAQRNGDLKLQGQDYLAHFVYPNFYFHLSTAYAILRHNGVELGKRDFVGSQ